MERAENSTECILEEPWKVSDKIEMIQHILNETNKRPFSFLFSNCHSKGETIVTFLALLELMKSGSCFVGKENKAIFIYAGSYEEIKNGKS
jgi:segregation and condensation protein A